MLTVICRWGGLLCGITAFLALVFVGLLGFYLYDRHASRKAQAQGDVENAAKELVRVYATVPITQSNVTSNVCLRANLETPCLVKGHSTMSNSD